VSHLRLTLRCLLIPLLCIGPLACQALAGTYDIHYQVVPQPETGTATVEIELRGKELPGQLEIHFDPERHRDFHSESPLDIEGEVATWRPEGDHASLGYTFEVNHKRDADSYDSRMTREWAILRSDQLIPPMAVRARPSLKSRAEFEFVLPDGWSVAAPYEKLDGSGRRYRLTDPGRRFIRPKGWLMLGAIASRQDEIAGVEVRVAAPRGQKIRLLDALAFISWTLPYLAEIFPDFPEHLLVVSAEDPMWRGGLSGPNSLFMHGDRPLISGNRTSSLVHELVHVGTSIHGTRDSDWIVEGIAEYYAAEILRRSGGISEQRFEDTLAELAEWGKRSEALFTGRSSGATTARAVGVMYAVDQELRQRTEGKASLDDVATALAKKGGKVTVKGFIDTAEQIGGGKLDAFDEVRALLKD
jgi:hypothetical protein